MPKRPKNQVDVEYYVPGRKRRVAGSSRATSDYLAIMHEDNPTLTISQLRELISDRTNHVFNPQAIEVLDAHINAGYGDTIPGWRF